MTKTNQMYEFNSMEATHAVGTAEAIFDALSCGLEVSAHLRELADLYGLSVEAIEAKVSELYGGLDDDDYYQEEAVHFS